MRDLILLAALLSVTPLIFRAPIVGLLTWIWITLMNPQREVYGFLSGYGLNFVVAVLTAAAWLMSNERKVPRLTATTILLIIFSLWTCASTYFALDYKYSSVFLDRTLKTTALSLIAVILVSNKSRMQAVIWVFVASLGYYAIKGGGFVLLTGGAHRVFGPSNSMIEDNNALGLALVMLIPLINYLRISSRTRLMRLSMAATLGFTFIAILGTYSRGALLALGAAAIAGAFRTRAGVGLLVVGGVLAMTLPAFMPSQWLDRMSSIQNYTEDASFEGRIGAWKTSTNIALHRPLGGGFSSVDLDWVAQAFHTPGSSPSGKAAHSIYFEVLGDHGFLGLMIYLTMLGSACLNTSMVLIQAKGRPELEWASQLGRALQVSFVAYMVGGAALSMAYYDGFILLIVLSAALLQIVRHTSKENVGDEPGPQWRHISRQAADAFAIPDSVSLPAASSRNS